MTAIWLILASEGCRAGSALRPQPGAGAAQRRHLDQIRLDSAVRRHYAPSVSRFALRGPGSASVDGVTEAADEVTGKWRTFGERVVYESPGVWFRQVDVGLPSRERVWQPVLRLRQAVAVALLDNQDRVLLIWRHRFVQDQWGWELPGGDVDEGEEPGAAAARELEEQTGYRAGRLEHLVTFQPLAEVVDAERVVFVGRDVQRVDEPVSLEGVERVEWVPLELVPGLIADGQVWNAGSVVGLLAVLARRP
jgi:8-oxo-dGDP phosphatase